MLPLLPFLIPAASILFGGVIGFAIAGYLDRKKIKEMQKAGALGSAIKCAVKKNNAVTFNDLENGKKYEIKCDGVSDDISVGDRFIYA